MLRQDATINHDHFYTYVWSSADGVPFYVGKGKGKRAWNTRNRSTAFAKIYAQGGCTVEIVKYFAREIDAKAHEVELVRLLGRQDNGAGTLVNLTNGGDGGSGLNFTDEAKAKISKANRGNQYSLGAIRSPETKARISAAKRGFGSRCGAVLSRETRDKIADSLRGRPLSYDHRAKISEVSRGKSKPLEHVARVTSALHMCPPRPNSSSGFKGVSPNRTTWVSRINVGNFRRTIGYFPTDVEAARAYDAAAIKAWGAGNCYLNFPNELRG